MKKGDLVTFYVEEQDESYHPAGQDGKECKYGLVIKSQGLN